MVYNGRGIASGHLIFVSGKGFQDFGLLALGDLEVIQAPPSSAATSSNSAGEIRRLRLLKAQAALRRAW